MIIAGNIVTFQEKSHWKTLFEDLILHNAIYATDVKENEANKFDKIALPRLMILLIKKYGFYSSSSMTN
jgi:hypothetical protein